MKNIFKYFIAMAAMAPALGALTSCQDDFDDHTPAMEAPVASLHSNITIEDFKEAFWQDAYQYCTEVGTMEDGQHYIISGRVTSTDLYGNVYKKLVIQDETAAIAFSINQNNMCQQYRIGQEVVIDATGMYIGKYRGLMQFGFPDTEGTSTTFMPYPFFTSHAELNGFPEPERIDTLQVKEINDIITLSGKEALIKYQSRIARFQNVYFEAGGEKTFSVYKVNTERYIYNEGLGTSGGQGVVRTSGYARFRNEILPKGTIDLVALLDYYLSKEGGTPVWQLTLNGTDGIMPATPIQGTEDNPYLVTDVVEFEQADNDAKGWMTGYIVGAVAPEVTTVASNEDIQWGADAELDITLVIGPTADCRDYTQCVVLPLPQGTPLRQYGNLVDNPANAGKQIWVYGNFAKYMGTWGITGNSGAAEYFRIEGVEIPDSPDTPAGEGDGTEANPFSTLQVAAMTTEKDVVAKSSAWVHGYIVGYMPSSGSTLLSNTVFAAGDVKTNIVLGPTADCKDYTQCITVQLPTNTVAPGVRDALNLADNPGLLGAEVDLCGDITLYCGGSGLKPTTAYKIIGGGSGGSGGDTPDTPTTGGSGTEASPYSTLQVAAMSTEKDVVAQSSAWVKGYIVGYMPSSGSTLLSNTVFAADGTVKTNIVLGPSASCKDYTQCITVQLPSNTVAPGVRDALNLVDNPGLLGAEVMLCGDITLYCGGSGLKPTTAYKIIGGGSGGSTGGDTPSTPTADAIYSGLVDNANGWIFDNVILPDVISDVWSWRTYNNSGYLNGSAYVNSESYEAEAYAYTTVRLPADSKPVLTFDHAAKFQTTLTAYCGVVIRVSGSNEWTSLQIPTWPTAGSWTFVSSGSIDLSAYAGKSVDIGFKYGSSTRGADTWEVKNVLIAK